MAGRRRIRPLPKSGERVLEIEILLNGEPLRVESETTVAALVESLGLAPQQVAVELNAALVERERRTATRLAAGDRVELVTLVGGG